MLLIFASRFNVVKVSVQVLFILIEVDLNDSILILNVILQQRLFIFSSFFQGLHHVAKI
jgi:hypothetical protein